MNECSGWSTKVKVTMCPGSCNNGHDTCRYIAGQASEGSIKIGPNACSNGYGICMGIGQSIREHLDVEVETGACNGWEFRCHNIGGDAQDLDKILIPENECNDEYQDFTAGKCENCGKNSSFQGTFRATTECCAADGKYYGSLGNTYSDDDCNYTPAEAPSSLPSNVPSDIPSSIPSEIPSGK